MLTAGHLFSVGAGAARRQKWAFVPLYLGVVLGRLLGLMPSLTMAARFVRSGFIGGASDPAGAYVLGFLSSLDEIDRWLPAWVAGSAVAAFGGWLLGIVLQAGALRQLAAQASTPDLASDEAFAEGVLRAPASYLVTAALAEVLKLMMLGCALGSLISAMSYFTAQPGALAALMMTIATATVIVLPVIVAALEVGFARSVILDESPSVALAEGLLLSWKRLGAFLPPWYLLKLAGFVVAVATGFTLITVSALPGEQGLWILRYGPIAMVSLLGMAGSTAIAFGQLGINAALVAEATGTLSTPPPVIEPVLVAAAVVPAEPVLVAREVPPEEPILVAREVPPEEPPKE